MDEADLPAIKPEFIEQPNGKFSLKNVPIFKCLTRDNINYDEKACEEIVKAQQEFKKSGYLPRLHIGHNNDENEKPAVGFLDNYRFDKDLKMIFADFIDVVKEIADSIKQNLFPGRSVEINAEKNEINSVALLGGSAPYIKLPDLRFKEIFFKETIMKNKKFDESEPGIKKPDTVVETKDEGAEDEGYTNFCKYMQRFEEEKAKKDEVEGGEKANETLEKKDDHYSQEVIDLKHKLAQLENNSEIKDWIHKYSEHKLEVDNNVKLLMQIPKNLRPAVFASQVNLIQKPSMTAFKDKDISFNESNIEQLLAERKKQIKENYKKGA